MRTAARVLVAVLMASWWLVVPATGGAAADDPVDLSRQGQITDRADALDDRAAEVSRALDRLYDEQRLQLFVVYVTSFSGRSAQEWAAETATRNGLGTNDVLLAVATRDRQYAYWVDAASRLTDAQLAEVARTAVEPALRENDWAGAAIGAADGYGAVTAGEPVPTVNITPGEADPGDGGGAGTGAGDLVLPIAILGGAAVLAAYAYTKRRRRTATRTTPRGGQEGWGAPEQPPLPELDARARTALVETDDAVRTSQEELGFATAQFGEEAARPFHEAVAHAKKELTAAFRLRQQLDDAYPEDDATRRRMLDEILARCSEADRRLDAEAEDFDRLRALERNAPQALDAAAAAFQDVDGRVVSAEATLGVMRERYAASAAAPVANDVEQAKDRLQFAAAALDRGRQAVEAGDNGSAAVQVRAAEGAVAQAARLIEAVDRRARELAEATGKLPSALTETETDLAEARGLLKGTEEGTSTAGLQGRIARAETVAAEVRTATESGRYDPIDALRRVEEADAALDEALAGIREQEQGTRRARALLERAVLGARSGIGAATDYITTHRGAVGSEARTRLAEAQRRLERAQALAGPDGTGGDAQTALAEAQRADWLAQQAQSLAENDVRDFRNPFGPGGTPGAGGPGGGLGGAVLGGILLGGMLGGGGRGGGLGGGFGGGFGGGPGSFGGGGTRGRMGGGRF
ncbi:TPM domain-containing protein [Streptomyces pristinaespiralis]|uniref:Fibrillarin n=2 Tax=Streptomyces pristinaespiralis TaxID=38300 RepID=A0A0M5IN16_STRPR|nr:TPM domain-containing protein [Streptomyces pristinaespiralis]ALC21081.1 fibrillarin [Streptomyces pristinaespiralis]QMU16154.1 TPM domain-containing protein [Streptomyces pristinaespiralis]